LFSIVVGIPPPPAAAVAPAAGDGAEVAPPA
jgi:hypothetical protein